MKHVMHAIGENDLANRVGSGSMDLARLVGGKSADAARLVGTKSADAARVVGATTVDVARRIGPKRALIGLAILGAVIGGSIYLARYLRARADEADEAELPTGTGVRTKKQRRAQRAKMDRAAASVTH